MNFEFQVQEQLVTDQDETFTGAAGGSANHQQQQQVEKKKNQSIEKVQLSTPNTKLIIKLKPDPMAAQLENDDGAVSADRSSSMNIRRNPASCKHCRKEFSSGKALGAHMRVHPNHSNENRSLSAGISRFRGSGSGSKSYLDDLLKDGKPTCTICGKSFASAKSLFGHMRCHPERQWRGMQPPQRPSDEPAAAPSSSCSELISPSGGTHHIGTGSSSSHHDQNYKIVTDLEQCLPGWSIKDRRGRKSSLAKMSTCDNGYDDDDEMILSSAAHGLMMLQAASNKHHPSEIGEGDSHLVCKCSCPNQSENGICECGFGGDDDADDHHQLVLKSSKRYYDCGDEMETCESDYQQEKVKKRKVTRAAMNLKVDIEYSSNDHVEYKTTPPPGAVAERCYKCMTCDKSFASPQALGGHRSSAHNKMFSRNISSNPQVLLKDAVFDNNCGEWDRLGADDMSTAREVVHPPPAVQHHVCRTCDKAFPSGQALGGHQRCHWQGPPSSSSSSSPAAAGQQLMNMMCDDQSGSPAAAAAASTKKPEALDFDLNEFPANNDHQEEGSK